jgi:hypothetical protein
VRAGSTDSATVNGRVHGRWCFERLRVAAGQSRPLGDQESIGRDGERGVIVAAAQPRPPIVAKAYFLPQESLCVTNPRRIGQALYGTIKIAC